MLIGKLATCINDLRHQSYVLHGIDPMMRQWVMQIGDGYEDANDCNALRSDGILKVCAGQEQILATFHVPPGKLVTPIL